MVKSEFRQYACEEENVDSQAVENFVNGLNSTGLEYHSFILFRNNHMIAKGCWKPYDGQEVHNIHSSSKSFTSTAIGMLYDQGRIRLDSRVTEYFPGRCWPLATEEVKSLTVRHLLTMSMGQNFEGVQEEWNSWTDAAMGQPIVRKPGTGFFYSSMCSHILSEIFTKITGESVLEFLRRELFSPMGFGDNYWFAGPGNTVAGGGGLHISIDDFAKLGLLYLNHGVYKGRRYLSEEWVNMATSLQIETAPAYPSSRTENSQGYGFQFWRCTHNGFRASGMWAQMCLVLPDQNMVLAVHSSGTGSEATLQQVWKHLLPGVKGYDLEPDREKTEKLNRFLESQTIPSADGGRESRLEKEVPEHYVFSRNPYGFRELELCFRPDRIRVTIVHEWGTYQASCGRGEFLPDPESNLGELTHLERDLHMPSEPEGYIRPKIFSRAVWTDESQLLISQRMLNAAAQIGWLFRFDGSCVQVLHQSRNVYGSFKDVMLTAPYQIRSDI